MDHGLISVLEENHDRLTRYCRAQGVGEVSEDLLQELRLRLISVAPGPVAAPLAYLYRILTNLIIDRRRSETQRLRRDEAWAERHDRASDADFQPSAERLLMGRQALARVEEALETLTPRAREIFRRHRLDGQVQRAIAEEMGCSRSTVEADLRDAYRLLDRVRRALDEE